MTPAPPVKRRRPWRGLLWVAAAMIPLAGVAVWLAWFSPWFTVAAVDVTIVSTDGVVDDSQVSADVERVIAIPVGTALASISTEDIATRVAALPAVREVSVERQLPDTILVTVTPRIVVAAARGPNGFDLVDAEGMVVREDRTRPGDLPVVDASGAGLAAALTVAGELPQWLRTQTDGISATTRNNVELTLRDGAIVRWGGVDSPELKAAVLTALLPGKWQVYDVSAPQVPTTA